MNKQESDILYALNLEPYINQRILSESCGHSLGVVNRSIKNLMEEGLLDTELRLTEKAKLEFQKRAPRNAVILAAGFLHGDSIHVCISEDIPKKKSGFAGMAG